MTNWLTDAEQRAWRAYRRMTLLVDAAVARELARDSGLSMPDYQVLSTLSEAADHRRRLTELALRMQWSPSRLSHHVTRMEQRGLVTRADCSEDLRAAYVVLSPAGWDAIRAAAPDHVASVRRHLVDLLTADEIAALTGIGEKVAGHFGEQCLDAPEQRGTSGQDCGTARDCADQDCGAAQDGAPDQQDDAAPCPPVTAVDGYPGQSAKRSPVSRS